MNYRPVYHVQHTYTHKRLDISIYDNAIPDPGSFGGITVSLGDTEGMREAAIFIGK